MARLREELKTASERAGEAEQRAEDLESEMQTLMETTQAEVQKLEDRARRDRDEERARMEAAEAAEASLFASAQNSVKVAPRSTIPRTPQMLTAIGDD